MEEVKKQGVENLFVPYEIALDLKELGFDELCLAFYWITGKFYITAEYHNYVGFHKQNQLGDYNYDSISAPTFSQAFRWFREKHNLYQDISTFVWDYDKKQLAFSLRTYLNPLNVTTEKKVHPEVYKTYEETELECLKKLIEIVKEKFAQVKN